MASRCGLFSFGEQDSTTRREFLYRYNCTLHSELIMSARLSWHPKKLVLNYTSYGEGLVRQKQT